jgi:ubiquinone biosynthesis protein UbiJ
MPTQHDPAVVTAVLTAVEAALQRAVDLSPATRQRLQKLGNTLMAIEFTAPEIEVFIAIDPEGNLTLASYTERQPSVRVRGPLQSFAQLASADDPAAMLINSDIEVIGNTAPLLELQAAVASMEIDWEAPLVSALGDVMGHQLAELFRGLFSWGEHAAASLRRQLSEFILEEGRLSPPALELEDFYQQVHSLSLRVDRLESRARRLATRIEQLTS